MKHQPQQRTLVKNITLALTTIILLLFLLELFVRFGMKDMEPWHSDSLLGSTHIPNKITWWCKTEFCHSFTSNSDGFIDEEFSPEKKSNERRIFLFGDSFMEAFQVDQTNSTAHLLEKRMKEQNENNTVYNFGVSNYGTAQYLLALLKYTPEYHPDVVIFTLLTQNDLRNVNPSLEPDKCRPFFLPEEDKLKYKPNPCLPSATEKIVASSKIFRYASKGLNLLKQSIYFKRYGEYGIPLDFYVYNTQDKNFHQSFFITEQIILNAKAFTEKNGAKFLLVILTNPHQVDDTRWSSLQEQYPKMKTVEWDPLYPDRRLQEFCQRENIDCLFLLPHFREEFTQTKEPLHFPKDGHWNERGHELAAEEIHKLIIGEQIFN
ncbi:MAG: hypothetical protein AABX37_05815 [Nanoarchaeota archaeon]